MSNDLAYLALIQLHIEQLPGDVQVQVGQLVDRLQKVLDVYGLPEISPIAITVICARNLVEMTMGGSDDAQ